MSSTGVCVLTPSTTCVTGIHDAGGVRRNYRTEGHIPINTVLQYDDSDKYRITI